MKVSRTISLEDLGEHLSIAKERLSQEKNDIMKRDRLQRGFSHQEYAFAYLRAERTGMQAIHMRLAEIAWLPMQLDPESELVSENRGAMKDWMKLEGGAHPGAAEFGNDFIHALTRSALLHGWDEALTRKLMARIANLFRDLSCLIAIIYYTTWLAEHEVEGIALTDPEDLNCSVVEIAALVQSPQLHRALRRREEVLKKAQAKKALEKTSAKTPPFLRVIHNESYREEAFGGDTVPV